MAGPTQHFFESQRLRLSYWDWGNEGATPLILIHGGRDHARVWDRVAEALADDHHVVSLDLRGHGDSEWSLGGSYGVPQNVLDLVRLIEVVGGPVIVFAHSYGGQIALATAATYPELFSKVIAIEGTASVTPLGYTEEMTPEWLHRWTEQLRSFEDQTSQRVYASIEEAAARMQQANPRLPLDELPILASYAVKPVEGGYVWKFDNWVHGRTSLEIRRQESPRFWAAIEAPVLLFYGAKSRAKQAPEEVPYFRDVRHVIVPDAGHWVHHDQLETVIREVRAFLAEPSRAD